MRTQQATGWTRRRVLAGLIAAGVAGHFSQPLGPGAARSGPLTPENTAMETSLPSLERPGDEPVASTAHFAFHSQPWVSLHHFVYQWARQDAARAARSWPPIVDIPERGQGGDLSPSHQHAWRATLALYQRQVILRDLTFDAVLRTLRHRLVRLDSAEAETSPVLVAQVLEALRAVMPLYHAHWWGAHDEANRRWIAQVLPQLAETEAWLVTRLTEVYGGSWPAGPLRVDLTAYASWHGAYTTTAESPAPSQCTIASTDPANQEGGALEVLVHEASHVVGSWVGPQGVEGPLEAALATAYNARRETPPAELGHVIIFYSVGELTRQALQAHGRPGYTPYAERQGLYTRSLAWTGYRQALVTHWQPYLDGTIDRTTALQRLVAELG